MERKKILVVEDEGVTAMGLKATLLELGYDVLAVVASGEEAVRQARALQPDLILMDITLDGSMNGIQAAAEIKKGHAIPIIYLTAHADAETLDQAKPTEPFGFLPKPCSRETMAATITVALSKAEFEAERHQAHLAMRRVLAEQKVILDNIGVGVLFLKDRKIMWANPVIATMFGYQGEDPRGQGTEIFYPDRQTYREVGAKAYAALAQGAVYSCQTPMRKKDGSPLWCNLVGQAINPAQPEEGAIWIVEDVTERRHLEEALRQSAEKYRTVADFTHDWEFWIGPEETTLYCSPSCERISGHPAAAFIANPSLQRQLIHPDDRAAWDGHRHAVVAGEKSLPFIYRILRADGETRWIAHVCQPVFDSQGQFAGTRGSNRDVTEQKLMENEAAKTRNLAALGVLAGGIAHDFNNLLQGLLGNVSLAQMYTPIDSEAYKFLQNAEQSYTQASRLTAQLAAFATGGISLQVSLQPAALIREVVMAEVSAYKGPGGTGEAPPVEVDLNLPSDLGQIRVDPMQFGLCLKHLITNALDAMVAGGKLRVTAVNETLSTEAAKAFNLVAGNYLRISVHDQGTGISPVHLPRIFDPYFSTKERCAQKGMGLGLALCNTIVQKHGGAITVDTALGQGSIFHIRLPMLADAVEPQAAGLAANQGPAGQGARILIMDDDQGVLSVATEFLGRCGYRVDETGGGNATVEAYQEARAGGDPYALVILDLIIPGGIGGKEVLDILKGMDPEVKAIVSSGYVDDPVMINFADYGFVAAVQKPYQLREMKELLARLI